jgi:hypothetical protein
MFVGFRKGRWWVWAGAFFFVVMNHLVMFLSLGNTFGFSPDLTNLRENTSQAVLKSRYAILISKRASSVTVGTIMALLATFDEAGVLPPEGTAQANHVIHGLIQLQAAMMKSPSSELAAYRKAAIAHWMSQSKERRAGVVGDKGLTDRVLAALVAYDLEHPLWDDPKIVLAMQAFNVAHVDWILIVDLFHQAEAVFREQGRSIHAVYEIWRMNVPGGKP